MKKEEFTDDEKRLIELRQLDPDSGERDKQRTLVECAEILKKERRFSQAGEINRARVRHIELGIIARLKERSFFQACEKGEVEKVRHLIKEGVKVNAKDEQGWTALLSAAESGQKEIVELLISSGADPLLADKTCGCVPMRLAAGRGYMDIAKILIDHYPNVDVMEYDGDTALVWAASYGHEELVRFLLDKGADINKGNTFEKFTPLIGAVMTGPGESNDDKAYHMVTLLIHKGANVNAGDDHNFTALYWAATRGYYKTATLLIDSGAVVNCRLIDGRTPLSEAKRKGDKTMTELLIKHGAKE